MKESVFPECVGEAQDYEGTWAARSVVDQKEQKKGDEAEGLHEEETIVRTTYRGASLDMGHDTMIPNIQYDVRTIGNMLKIRT